MSRLPVPGDDHGVWGELLNEYLAREHTQDGSLKIRSDGTLDKFVTTSALKANFENAIERAGALPGHQVVLANDGKSLVLAAATTTTSSSTTTVSAQRYTTTSDQTKLLAASQTPNFAPIAKVGANDVIVTPSEQFQSMLGFGAALTDSAAYCLMHYLTDTQRANLLNELFSPSRCNWSTLRICIGSPDFTSVTPYTYDDMPAGQTDVNLTQFSVAKDTTYLIPLMQQILAINPSLRIFASIWRAPSWMMQTSSTFNDTYFPTYAQYFVKFVQAYQSYGIPIWAISPQNEPNIPTKIALSAQEEITFIGQHLGPAFDQAGLSTKIVALDDDWSRTAYATSVLSDPVAAPYVDGIGWHGYNGDASAQTTMQRSFPTKNHYFTELRTLQADSWNTAMQIMVGNVAVGSLRNWGRSITLWNLALDQNGKPTYGSPGRRGVITIPSDSSGNIVRNAEYYMLTHLAAYVRGGAYRISSTTYGTGRWTSQLETVAFQNPDGSLALLCFNPATTTKTFQIIDSRSNAGFSVTMQPGELSTFTWGAPATPPPPEETVPAQPVLVATNGIGQVNLSWGVPDNSSTVTGYTLLRGTAPGTETTLATLAGTANSFTDQITTPGSYYYTLVASNSAGNSAASAEVSVTITATTVPVVDAVSGANTSTTQVAVLNWQHTIGSASNPLLVVAVQATASSSGTASVKSVTYRGVPLIRLVSATTTGSHQRLAELWYLVGPVAGAGQVTVTTNIPTSIAANALSYMNVSQTAPFGANNIYTSTSTVDITASVPSLQSDLIISAACMRSTLAPKTTSGQTQQWLAQASSNAWGVGSTRAGTGDNVVAEYTFATADHGVLVMAAIHGN